MYIHADLHKVNIFKCQTKRIIGLRKMSNVEIGVVVPVCFVVVWGDELFRVENVN